MRKLRGFLLGFLIVGLAFMALPVKSLAKVARVHVIDISLSTNPTTTAASGTSALLVNGISGASRIYIGDLETGVFGIQLASSSGLTVASGSVSGDNSAVTGTLRYKESTVNTQENWDAAATTDIWTGLAFFTSGTSMQQVEIFPETLGWITFEWVSGITPMGRVDFKFTTID